MNYKGVKNFIMLSKEKRIEKNREVEMYFLAILQNIYHSAGEKERREYKEIYEMILRETKNC